MYKAGGNKGKIVITPNKDRAVRQRFVETLTELIGHNAVADLNVKKSDQVKQLEKFKRGYGRYWQCQSCGELHEESLPKCDTRVCVVRLDDASQGDDAKPAGKGRSGSGGARHGEVRRHLQDVSKVRKEGDSATIFIGNTVKVFQQGTTTEEGRGKIRALGYCKGKRPDDDPSAKLGAAGFHNAPKDSCFVLVLNRECMEGLDVPDVKVMYEVEPILREDKEEQARARATRLGGNRDVKITQLIMEDTIEDQAPAAHDPNPRAHTASDREQCEAHAFGSRADPQGPQGDPGAALGRQAICEGRAEGQRGF